MLKKAALATGVFAITAMAAAGMTYAQTTTGTPTPTVASTDDSTMDDTTPAAPASTGRAE